MIDLKNNNYRNIYFVAKALNNNIPNINYSKKNQYCEISKIEWFDYDTALNVMRPYNLEKKELLSQINCILT